ncbi:MAG: hypothetical protein HYZ72_10900 [Deltaproteobacteria bacterium]|nr:hypothetical protein [Deltaproteobacteria bacterium]
MVGLGPDAEIGIERLLGLVIQWYAPLLVTFADDLAVPAALILGCSVTAAKVRAFRALKALRAALGDVKDLC